MGSPRQWRTAQHTWRETGVLGSGATSTVFGVVNEAGVDGALKWAHAAEAPPVAAEAERLTRYRASFATRFGGEPPFPAVLDRDDGQRLFVMSRVAGVSAEQLLAGHPLPATQAADELGSIKLVLGVAEALLVVEMHREAALDLKTDAIFWRPSAPQAVLIDWNVVELDPDGTVGPPWHARFLKALLDALGAGHAVERVPSEGAPPPRWQAYAPVVQAALTALRGCRTTTEVWSTLTAAIHDSSTWADQTEPERRPPQPEQHPPQPEQHPAQPEHHPPHPDPEGSSPTLPDEPATSAKAAQRRRARDTPPDRLEIERRRFMLRGQIRVAQLEPLARSGAVAALVALAEQWSSLGETPDTHHGWTARLVAALWGSARIGGCLPLADAERAIDRACSGIEAAARQVDSPESPAALIEQIDQIESAIDALTHAFDEGRIPAEARSTAEVFLDAGRARLAGQRDALERLTADLDRWAIAARRAALLEQIEQWRTLARARLDLPLVAQIERELVASIEQRAGRIGRRRAAALMAALDPDAPLPRSMGGPSWRWAVGVLIALLLGGVAVWLTGAFGDRRGGVTDGGGRVGEAPTASHPDDAEPRATGLAPNARSMPDGAGPSGAGPLGADPSGAGPLGADPSGAGPRGARPRGARPRGARPPAADPPGAGALLPPGQTDGIERRPTAARRPGGEPPDPARADDPSRGQARREAPRANPPTPAADRRAMGGATERQAAVAPRRPSGRRPARDVGPGTAHGLDPTEGARKRGAHGHGEPRSPGPQATPRASAAPDAGPAAAPSAAPRPDAGVEPPVRQPPSGSERLGPVAKPPNRRSTDGSR